MSGCGGCTVARALLLGSALAVVAPATAQRLTEDPWATRQAFLSREYHPLWGERYENYSLLSYRDYGIRADQPTYDPFGTYLLDGQTILSVSESRTRQERTGASSASWGLSRFRNLVIMRDNYGSWGSRFMVGDLLDGHFTPLTLNLARLEGVRWDASSHRNSFSLVSSRWPRPQSETRPFTHYLTGGHWQSQLGDVLTFGATYVNLSLQDAHSRNNSLRGQAPLRLEGVRDFYLIVTDDSPEDGAGARVYDVRVSSGGQVLDLTPDVRRVPELVGVDHVAHIRRDGAWGPSIPDRDRLLRANGFYDSQGLPVDERAGPVEVSGTDMLVYRYEVPGGIDDLSYDLRVAGDYAIDVAASYPFVGGGASRWNDVHNVARAAGNVRDGSNLAWVAVDYGLPTGLEHWGGNVEAKAFGFEVAGEYVESVRHFQFPAGGDRQQRTAGALYGRALRQRGAWRLGLEVVDLPAAYDTSLPVWSAAGQTVIDGDLIDDNDDRDEWPDGVEHWDPLNPEYVLGVRTGLDVDERTPAQTTNYGLSGGFGVYPGLDADDDGTIDVNVNRNQFPDYAEPFFMYAVDADEFVYGDDFNNNGIVDVRENDARPDLPYRRDQRGYHGFFGYQPGAALGVRLGHYRMAQAAAAGRNEVAYGEVRSALGRAGLGTLTANYRLKRVRDDIADPLYMHVFDQGTRAQVAVRLRPDPLLMTDSVVHTLFAQADVTAVAGLRLTQALKAERNRMGSTAERDGGAVDEVTAVGKADWAWPLGNLTFRPMAKFALHRRWAPDAVVDDIDTREAFPILRADYALSPRTFLRAGLQGLPGFPQRYRDRQGPSTDYDARHVVVALQNRSNYTGYEVSTNLSWRSSRSRFIHLRGRPLERFAEFMIQVQVL